MEEIYIIKLKGPASPESIRDNKSSFYYSKDLTGEALLGFGILHTFIGSTLILLSVINLLRLDISTSTVLGTGIWCGAIFAVTGFMAVITAHKRKTDISKSKIQVKIFLILSIVSLLLTASYLILLALDLKEKSFNEYIASNILISFTFELFTSLLSIFTCVRVIWPGSLAFCAKDWPMHQKLKRKIIVSTQIYTNGVTQNEDMIRNLGPNCVISLVTPSKDAINNKSDNFSDNYLNICEFCVQNTGEYKPNTCEHILRDNCVNDENQFDEHYDSEFDVETLDSMTDNEMVSESTHREQEFEINIESHSNKSMDCTQVSEHTYDTIDGNKTLDESLNNDSNDKSEDNLIKESVVSSESQVSLKSYQISEEYLNEV